MSASLSDSVVLQARFFTIFFNNDCFPEFDLIIDFFAALKAGFIDFCQNMHFGAFERLSMHLRLARANLKSAVACDSLRLHAVVCGRLRSLAHAPFYYIGALLVLRIRGFDYMDCLYA